MLAVTDHDLGDTDLACAAERLVQNCVGFFPTLLRFEKIWPVEKLRIDLFQIHKVRDVNGVRGLNAHLLEVLILHDNVTASFVFEPLYDLVGWHFFRVGFRHFLVSNRAKIAGTKLSKAKLFFARGRINRHGNINQPKADAAFPNRSHKKCFSHSRLALSITEASIPPAEIALQLPESA